MAKAARKIEPLDMQPGNITELPLDLIDFDPAQPRKDFDPDFINELALDISQSRVKQPITVRPNPDAAGRYFVVYGENRTRASRVAGKLTIPAILASNDEIGDPMTLLLNQVKENHIRRALNPIELAHVLRRLRDDFKIKSAAKIEETLKAHGISNLSESYISNLIRLINLPDWAQDATRSGRLSAAHGKYLLQAAVSEPVMEELRAEIIDEGGNLSVRDLQETIVDLFGEHHIKLDRSWGQPVDYNEQCIGKKCKKLCKISGAENVQGGAYCLDNACYNVKKEEALNAPDDDGGEEDDNDGEGAVEPTPSADGSIDIHAEANHGLRWQSLQHARFDTTECESCQHRHTVMSGESSMGLGCFNPIRQCYGNKTHAAIETDRAEREAEESIISWVREELHELSYDNDWIAKSIILAAAMSSDYRLDEHRDTARNNSSIYSMRQLLTLDHDAILDKVIPHLLKGMDIEDIVPLAQRADINIAQIVHVKDAADVWQRIIERADEANDGLEQDGAELANDE